MKESRIGLCLSRHFKSIQSTIFTAVAILVLSAVLIVTAVSVQYTDSAIFENSVLYTQTITKQINQNIDSYIDYMENISSLVAHSSDVQTYLNIIFSGEILMEDMKNVFWSSSGLF